MTAQGGGSIVNISSLLGSRDLPGASLCTGSKHVDMQWNVSGLHRRKRGAGLNPVYLFQFTGPQGGGGNRKVFANRTKDAPVDLASTRQPYKEQNRTQNKRECEKLEYANF
jgi:hypothetical protein